MTETKITKNGPCPVWDITQLVDFNPMALSDE